MKSALVLTVLIVGCSAYAQECYSDFDCGGLGQKCVKDQWATTGYCVQLYRDKFKVQPRYDLPDPDSIGPGKRRGNCMFDTDCDVVYEYCNKNPGQVYGVCLLR